MKKYRRIFVLVMDSLGIGNAKDSDRFHQTGNISDLGSNTFKHISQNYDLNIPTLENLGIKDIVDLNNIFNKTHKNSFVTRLNEASLGKDTMTGHWEMMGIKTIKPFQTFTDTGFPKELIDELERRTGYKYIGNYAASGTEILDNLGERHIKTNEIIIYTSSDSVLQLCASEETIGLEELYRCCEVARELCTRPEWFVGRVIARPFIGKKKGEFKRTSNRHDYAVSPSGITTLDILKNNNYEVISIGKIRDIFNGVGITKSIKTVSNNDGMDKTIALAKNKTEFNEGLCFINLVEFDSEFGHRRNVNGYGKAIDEFDIKLKNLINELENDDLLMITADHGNDPTWKGTDHTREQVPLLIYSKSIDNGTLLDDRESFADIGDTILSNFELEKDQSMIGKTIKEIF